MPTEPPKQPGISRAFFRKEERVPFRAPKHKRIPQKGNRKVPKDPLKKPCYSPK